MNVLDVRTFWKDVARLQCVKEGGLKSDLVLWRNITYIFLTQAEFVLQTVSLLNGKGKGLSG